MMRLVLFLVPLALSLVGNALLWQRLSSSLEDLARARVHVEAVEMENRAGAAALAEAVAARRATEERERQRVEAFRDLELRAPYLSDVQYFHELDLLLRSAADPSAASSGRAAVPMFPAPGQ